MLTGRSYQTLCLLTIIIQRNESSAFHANNSHVVVRTIIIAMAIVRSKNAIAPQASNELRYASCRMTLTSQMKAFSCITATLPFLGSSAARCMHGTRRAARTWVSGGV